MRTIIGETFTDRAIFIDGIKFGRCDFIRCQLFYRATEQAFFRECTLDQCEWVFEDAAENMFALLSSIFRGTNGEGQNLVEAIFDGIRDGSISGEVKAAKERVPA